MSGGQSYGLQLACEMQGVVRQGLFVVRDVGRIFRWGGLLQAVRSGRGQHVCLAVWLVSPLLGEVRRGRVEVGRREVLWGGWSPRVGGQSARKVGRRLVILVLHARSPCDSLLRRVHAYQIIIKPQ